MSGKKPVKDCEVWWENYPEIRDITDDSGFYSLERVPPGSQWVVAKYPVGAGGPVLKMKCRSEELKVTDIPEVIKVPDMVIETARNIVIGQLRDTEGKILPENTLMTLWGETFRVGKDGFFTSPPLPDSYSDAEILVQLPAGNGVFSFDAPFVSDVVLAFMGLTLGISPRSGNNAPSVILKAYSGAELVSKTNAGNKNTAGNTNTITVTNNLTISAIGNSVTFTVTYAATGALAVSSIAVTTQPTKLSYAEVTDGTLALDGMVITETNNDGSTNTVPFAAGTAAGYTANPANGDSLTNASHNATAVTVTYTASSKTANTSNLTVLRDYTSAKIGTLKFVPAGTFQRDATPANVSTVSTFRMSQHEISRAQFLAIMGTDPSNTGVGSLGTNTPVQMVAWYYAIAFCNKLSLAEGLTRAYAVTGVDFSTLT